MKGKGVGVGLLHQNDICQNQRHVTCLSKHWINGKMKSVSLLLRAIYFNSVLPTNRNKRERWYMDRWVYRYSGASVWWFSNMTDIWGSIATEGQIYGWPIVSKIDNISPSFSVSTLCMLLFLSLARHKPKVAKDVETEMSVLIFWWISSPVGSQHCFIYPRARSPFLLLRRSAG